MTMCLDMKNCRVCGSASIIYAFSSFNTIDSYAKNCKFNYLRCNDCGSYTLNPIPDNLASYYIYPYVPYKTDISPTIEKLYLKLEAAKLEIVQRYIKSGTLIDVGTATGSFLVLAQKKGFMVKGIEQDASCCKRLRDDFGIDVLHSENPAKTLLDIPQHDVATAFHVIEHLVDLRSFLKAMSQAVKPGGFIVLSTPNPNSLSFAVYGRHWVHLDPPRHVSLITVKALDEIMASHNCFQVGLTYRDQVGVTLSKWAWKIPTWHWIGHILGIKRRDYLWNYFNRLLGLIMFPLDAFLPKRSAAYTVVYRRDS
ncbi:MAG: class I SAM-dependent methyltransferase [Candidatus Electrothrix sp. AX2]|nr:class I SAM-dependent methyltransferase [Candidatus Electrothrix gigas]